MVLREGYNYPLPVQRPSSLGDKFIYVDYVNNEPFYIGMGNWVRVRNPDRNDYHVRMLYNLHPKDRWIRRVVARNLSTNDAFNLEHTLILCYGRKDIGTGILVNKNNGIGTDLRKLSAPGLSASKALPKAVACLVTWLNVPAFASGNVIALFFSGIAGSVFILFLLVIIREDMGRRTQRDAPARDVAVSSSIPSVITPQISTSPPVLRPTATLAPSVPAATQAPQVLAVATPTPHITGTTIEAKWPDGRKLLHPDQFVRTRVVNVKANDT
jgi:hypothetical protein